MEERIADYEAAGLDLLLLQMSPQAEEMDRFAAAGDKRLMPDADEGLGWSGNFVGAVELRDLKRLQVDISTQRRLISTIGPFGPCPSAKGVHPQWRQNRKLITPLFQR